MIYESNIKENKYINMTDSKEMQKKSLFIK